MMNLFARYQGRFQAAQEEEMSIQQYLELCRHDKSAYASVAERMLSVVMTCRKQTRSFFHSVTDVVGGAGAKLLPRG